MKPKRYKMILLTGLMTVILSGCQVLELMKPSQKPVPTISKPSVEVFYQQENVCFTRNNATVFFDYVFELETALEDLR